MAFTVKPNGDIVCDTAEEAVALAEKLRAAAPAPVPAVGESISTSRWQAIHAKDKRLTAHVETLRAHAAFYGDLTPLQRRAVEMRVAGKWPHEIAAEMGRAVSTVQAILWDARKRLMRRAARAAETPDTSSFPPSTEAPKEEVSPPAAPPARKPRACGKCGGAGHNARTCRGEASAAGPPFAADLSTKSAVVKHPAICQPARLFIVCEDFEEEDGTAWIDGDVWEALEPTGEAVDDHQQWTMRRQGDGAEGVGFPSLHPFLQHDPRAAASAPDIQRVGMGLGARSVAA